MRAMRSPAGLPAASLAEPLRQENGRLPLQGEPAGKSMAQGLMGGFRRTRLAGSGRHRAPVSALRAPPANSTLVASHGKPPPPPVTRARERCRSEEHTSALQSLLRSSYDVF